MTAVRPAAQKEPTFKDNPNAPHYGVLMGGAKEIKMEGVGDASVGHLSIPRRALAEFVRLQYGQRNESPASLNEDRAGQWYNNPERIAFKTPRQCALNVFATFGDRGFIVPSSLTGLEYDDAVALFEMVMPKGTLVDVIKDLSTKTFPEDNKAEQLREELLAGAITARDYVSRYSSEIASEVLNAPKTGRGKGAFDALDIEYFRELNKPLPEEVPALATVAMGKEIAQSLQKSSTSSVNDEILKALIEQNALLREEVKNSRQASTVQTEPAVKKPSKAAGTAQE